MMRLVSSVCLKLSRLTSSLHYCFHTIFSATSQSIIILTSHFIFSKMFCFVIRVSGVVYEKDYTE